jgi:hypothetical protein
MKKLILVANDADACGKTTVSVLLQGILQRKNLRHTLLITSQEQELPFETVLMDSEEGFAPQDLVDLVDHADVVLGDLNTGGAAAFEKHFFRPRLDEALDEIECGVTVVLPVCDDAIVLHEAMDRARVWNKCAEIMVVHLPLLADEPMKYEGSAAEKYFHQIGATEVFLPTVNETIIDEIDAVDMDVPLALLQRQHLSRFVRNELHAWEVRCAESIRAAGESLLIPAASRAADLREDAVFGRELAF